MVNLRVVDIYHGDRVSSFKKAADFGIWGIIHKATTGATGKDAKYPTRRNPAGNAALLWGAYHWGTKADVAKQVKNFLDYAEPDQRTPSGLQSRATRAERWLDNRRRDSGSTLEMKAELGGHVRLRTVASQVSSHSRAHRVRHHGAAGAEWLFPTDRGVACVWCSISELSSAPTSTTSRITSSRPAKD